MGSLLISFASLFSPYVARRSGLRAIAKTAVATGTQIIIINPLWVLLFLFLGIRPWTLTNVAKQELLI